MIRSLLLVVLFFGFANSNAQQIITGADQLDAYLSYLQGKKVGLVVNHTSLVGNTHLTDTLLSLGIAVTKVFAPEHGFRGDADAGETVSSGIDKKTGIPLISLYGNTKKPSAEHLKDLDILIFDIQDVGVRFYTYISTMHYVMEACAENNKPLIILDRPNPNGDVVDGPVLESKFSSFVGLHPIPVLHGLTVAELAKMINGEGWLAKGQKANIILIECKNYTHSSSYQVPVKPSPNLPNHQSIRLYASLCFFEGTDISVGRGTYFPFQVIGFPDKKFGSFSFKPVSIAGMAKNPPHENKDCYGLDLRNVEVKPGLDLSYLIDFYKKSGSGDKFFNSYFRNLAGTESLKQQIIAGKTEAEIRKSWEADLNKYKAIRKKYLLYPDFE
jgi:uncharacterized protein YbbC (DUF1343 family)